MSNEIYIKKGPTKRRLTYEETIEALEMVSSSERELEVLEDFLKTMGTDLEGFAGEALSDNSKNGVFFEDWDGCNNFWTFKEAENGIMMTEQPLNGKGMKRGFKSKEDLDKEYISLSSFLKKGTYIGKFFRRTKNIYEDDKKYLPVNHSVFALYNLEGTILSIRQDDDRTVFEIISKRYTRDGNYEFYGAQKCNYDNIRIINKEIVKQLKK